MQGTVKWFDAAKGYGYISGDDGIDCFVHYSGIRGSGYRNLEDNQRVEYEVETDDRGPRARNVVVVIDDA